MHAIAVRGDDVTLHIGSAAFIALLAPIDTPEEAWLVLMDRPSTLRDEVEVEVARRMLATRP